MSNTRKHYTLKQIFQSNVHWKFKYFSLMLLLTPELLIYEWKDY